MCSEAFYIIHTKDISAAFNPKQSLIFLFARPIGLVSACCFARTPKHQLYVQKNGNFKTETKELTYCCQTRHSQ